MLNRKIVLLGSFAVGKTALATRYVEDRFDQEYGATEGVRIFKKRLDLDEQRVNLGIWDVGHVHDYASLPASYLRSAHAIIYVLDLSRKATLLAMEDDLEVIRAHADGIPRILVGNKTDLINQAELGTLMKGQNPPIDLICSALNGDRVDELFSRACELSLGV
jgi:small GTP-binding protein